MKNNIITKIRTKFNITQEELAHILNVSYTSINAWEKNKRFPQERMQKILLDMLEADKLESNIIKKEPVKGIVRSEAGFISSVIDYKNLRDTNPYTHSIGRWYGSLPSFLVGDLLRFIQTDYNNTGDVLVNFSGSGTVALEAAISGRKCIAFDANPMAVLLSSVKTNYQHKLNEDEVEAACNYVLDNREINIEEKKLSETNLLYSYNRWISEEGKLALKQICSGISQLNNSQIQKLMAVALASITINHSNIDKRCTNHYVYKEHKFDRKDLERAFYKEVNSYFECFDKFEELNNFVTPTIKLGNACDLDIADNSVSLVFSHPPYGTTINYYSINRIQISIMEAISFNESFSDGNEHSKCKKTDISSGTLKRFSSLTIDWVREAFRVLKPGGIFMTIIGDSRNSGKLSHPFTDIINKGEECGLIMKEFFIWVTNHKSGMHVKRKGNHIDHNYIIIMEKPIDEDTTNKR